jgi:uncharacterized protein involved in copper resistance
MTDSSKDQSMSGMNHDMSSMKGMDHDMSSMKGMDHICESMDDSSMKGMDHDMSSMKGMDQTYPMKAWITICLHESRIRYNLNDQIIYVRYEP